MRYIALYFFAFLIFLFLVSVGSCSGFPRNSSLVLPLLPGTGFSVYLLTSNTESCDEDEEVEGVVEEELADIQEPQVVQSWIYCNQSNGVYTYDPHRTVGVSSRSITLTNKSKCLTYTVASLLVRTSPLAVITVVGLLDVLMVSNSAESRSLLLTICIFAPESTTNSLSSRSFVDAAWSTHGSTHSSAGK